MSDFNIESYELVKTEDVILIKNINTTIGFVRYNKIGEVEYIFVNPIFRKRGVAKKLLKLLRNKFKKKIVFQKPISPLGLKLLKTLKKWN